jgi:methionine-rich copper-binding protein CopC
MRHSTLVGMIPLLLALAGSEAAAHAFLDHADPRVGNTVATAPREVRLWFTQKLEPAFSTVSVTDEAGQRVDTGKPRVSGDTMAISLRQIGSGT